MIEGKNKLTGEIIKQLKQGTKVEFKWSGSNNLYVGRIEVSDWNELYFVNEHCYTDDKLNEHDEGLRYYNRLDSFRHFNHFKILP